MERVTGWWFGTDDRKLGYGDNRKIVIGKTHKVKGEIIPCESGLHLSRKIIDALFYAQGEIIYRVVGSGVIVPHGNPIDKYACSERTYIDGIDATKILRKFARMCALDVIDMWDAPNNVIKFLKTGDESLSARARACACASASAWESASARAKQNKRLTYMVLRVMKKKEETNG